MTDFTTNFQLALPNFNLGGWHDLVNGNFQSIDALVFAVTGLSSFVGQWTNSTAYTQGQRVTDPETGTLWFCKVDHNSPGEGSFETYRTANPTHWQLVSSFPNARGAWDNEIVYSVGDWVYDDQQSIIAVCSTTHTSSASPNTIRDDAANWIFIFDLGNVAADIDDAVAAAEAARDLSQQWANEDEDVVVAGGEYSSKHYSIKSADQVTLAAAEVTNAAAQVTLAEAQVALAEAAADDTAADVVTTATARDKANEWAEKPEDSAVETGQFSALHHAAKAASAASGAATAAETALDNKITVSTDAPTGGSNGDIWFRVSV